MTYEIQTVGDGVLDSRSTDIAEIRDVEDAVPYKITTLYVKINGNKNHD